MGAVCPKSPLHSFNDYKSIAKFSQRRVFSRLRRSYTPIRYKNRASRSSKRGFYPIGEKCGLKVGLKIFELFENILGKAIGLTCRNSGWLGPKSGKRSAMRLVRSDQSKIRSWILVRDAARAKSVRGGRNMPAVPLATIPGSACKASRRIHGRF